MKKDRRQPINMISLDRRIRRIEVRKKIEWVSIVLTPILIFLVIFLVAITR